MKIALFGASGNIGQGILKEALARGHQVTVVMRDPSKVSAAKNLTAVKGDSLDAASVAAAVKGQDAVISAVGPGLTGDPQFLVHTARALIDGVKRAGVNRLIVVNGAGSLEVAPGVQLIDTAQFPEDWRPLGRAHAEALAVYRGCDLDWTAVSPAAMIGPGSRTGKFRTGGDQLLMDDQGNSNISVDDYAVALLDELEQPKNVRRRMTVAY